MATRTTRRPARTRAAAKRKTRPTPARKAAKKASPVAAAARRQKAAPKLTIVRGRGPAASFEGAGLTRVGRFVRHVGARTGSREWAARDGPPIR